MLVDQIKKKNRLINYNKYASYFHLLNFVSQVGLYYYLKEKAVRKEDERYEPYNIRINEINYGLEGDWCDNNILADDNSNTYNNIGQSVQSNFRNLREREVAKYQIPLSLIVASFSFMSFIAHTSLVIMDNKYYTWITDYKVNFLRWIEYFVSSPTMMLAILGLVRINDSSLIYNILVSTAVTNIFGLMAEITKNDPNYGFMSKYFYLIGFLPFGVSWAPIIDRFMKTSDNVKGGSESNFAIGYKKIFGLTAYNQNFQNNFQIPDFVKYTIFGLFGLYFLFPLNMGFHQYVSKSDNAFYNGELGYISLSFISKATLSWLVFSGTFSPNDDYLNNKDFSLIGGTFIKPKYIYYGLAGLGVTTLLASYNYKKSEPIENNTEDCYCKDEIELLAEYLENKGICIDDLNDRQLMKLLKKMKV